MRHLLRKTARLWGLQTGFINALGTYVETPEPVLIKMLEILSKKRTIGTKRQFLKTLSDQAKTQIIQRGLPAASVAKAGQGFSLRLYIAEDSFVKKLTVQVEPEDGNSFNLEASSVHRERRFKFNNKSYLRLKLNFDQDLSVGYYKIHLKVRSLKRKCLLLCCPSAEDQTQSSSKTWGLFAPLYAIKSKNDWGIGSLSELEKTRRFITKNGGHFLGSLPLLATQNTGDNYDPSPYSPLSKLNWNEIFLDVEKLVLNRKIGRLKTLPKLKKSNYVDYAQVYDLKKKILMGLAQDFFKSQEHRSFEYKAFLSSSPLVKEYARFRSPGNTKEQRFHLYVQFQMDQELKRQKKLADQNKIAGLYMDFPVGVSRKGFDSHHFSSSFLGRTTVGAPPDLMFSAGQNWGISPLHPVNLREQEYDYFIRCLRHHMKYAHFLRFDHAMAFHRLYVIPDGLDARQGAYIRYKREEFLAILKIESYRHKVTVVGEDLGTVPDEVRTALLENGFLRMWVLLFEAGKNPHKAARKAPIRCLACLNTHDMVPFEGYIQAKDLKIFERLNILSSKQTTREAKARAKLLKSWMRNLHVQKENQLYQALLKAVSQSPAQLFLINLEDLWQETEAQNVPGTWKEHPNWQRKFPCPIEKWSRDQNILRVLKNVSRWRAS